MKLYSVTYIVGIGSGNIAENTVVVEAESAMDSLHRGIKSQGGAFTTISSHDGQKAFTFRAADLLATSAVPYEEEKKPRAKRKAPLHRPTARRRVPKPEPPLGCPVGAHLPTLRPS